ncbi:MAG: hypothetical protein IJK63_02305 [Oscillospiraceae bacterium]|nr:hypothetical protein [Oscillospiraceae bacterium]
MKATKRRKTVLAPPMADEASTVFPAAVEKRKQTNVRSVFRAPQGEKRALPLILPGETRDDG